jgi:phosphopantetheinyl transferase
VNLIPTLQNPFLPKEITIGWDTIQKYKANKLPFIDAHFLDQTISEKRKNEHYSGRKLFGNLVDYLDLPASSIELLKTDLGKPYAKNGDKMIYTSFSHSQDWVLSGISLKFDIGLDCERLDRKISENVIDRIRSETEKAMMQDVSDLEMWTMKEAFVKCIGTGIRMNLKNYPITKQENKYVVRWQNVRIYIVPFIWQNHQLAVAWKKLR